MGSFRAVEHMQANGQAAGGVNHKADRLLQHLLHGAEAAHRNLGLLTPANGPSLRWGGRLLASVIGGGFLLTSLGLALGGLA